MWSLGCIAFEILCGLPIFPGNSEYDQIRMIVQVLGMPPDTLISKGSIKKIERLFKRSDGEKYTLKTLEDLISEHRNDKVRRMCFDIKSLDDISNITQVSYLLLRTIISYRIRNRKN